MNPAAALRSQIEATLGERIPSALTPAAKTIREFLPSGNTAIDALLNGGFPGGAVTEIVGQECSGRTSLALSFVAQVTKANRVCAWIDVSNTLSPESAAASGVDLKRLLWVRCGMGRIDRPSTPSSQDRFVLPEKVFVPQPIKRGLHGCGFGPHPRSEAKGLSDGVSGLLRADAITSRCAEPQRRVRAEREVFEPAIPQPFVRCGFPNTGVKPWLRIEQALRATDLLLQAGGFSAIVLDMGSIAPEHVLRIPLATWFRYSAAAERSRSSVILLTQYACSKSSAALVLKLQAEPALDKESTVLIGLEHLIEVSRQRFTEATPKVVALRKPPQRASSAEWRSSTTWATTR